MTNLLDMNKLVIIQKGEGCIQNEKSNLPITLYIP